MCALLLGILLLLLENLFVLVVPPIAVLRVYGHENMHRGRIRKSSTTRIRGHLRMTSPTAPSLSGSGRVDMPTSLLFYSSTGQLKIKYQKYEASCLKMARLKCGETVSRDSRCSTANAAIQQAQPYTQQRYVLAIVTYSILPGGCHPIDASRRWA